MPMRGFSKSIIVKITFWLVFVVLVGLGIIIGNQLINLRQTILAQFDVSRVQITRLLADKMSAAVRFNRPDAVKRAFQKMADDPDDSLAMLVVLDQNREQMVLYRRQGHETVLPDRLQQAVASSAAYAPQAPPEKAAPIVLSDENYTYVAVAVEHATTPPAKVIGALLTAFSRENIHRTSPPPSGRWW